MILNLRDSAGLLDELRAELDENQSKADELKGKLDEYQELLALTGPQVEAVRSQMTEEFRGKMDAASRQAKILAVCSFVGGCIVTVACSLIVA